jgi:formylglycine-generating enzyme required for sulfatase activity
MGQSQPSFLWRRDFFHGQLIKIMLNKIKSIPAVIASVLAMTPAHAQTPPTLDLHLFAGVNIIGPTGSVYAIQCTSDLAQSNSWTSLAFVQLPSTNHLWVDTSSAVGDRRFYRAILQTAPTNMVFIPPNSFLMGSPTNELSRTTDEGPQTTVILSRGFWIGKYEVTQGEYVSIMNINPSSFPGDLNRPISSVSWLDATNYCAKLTQQELAAGRIPAGSAYRLPTEAEWEYAARAGTSTRFSYGDDPDATNLINHAWYSANAGPSLHPVGLKLPNPWGLYDTEGNVWEWCSDWYGETLPGGVQIDPKGPPSNPIGFKVMRGGAYDYFDSDCRSARRLYFGAPTLTDSDLGFRVVLAVGP